MIAVDTNILVYSHRKESKFHPAANDLVRNLAEGRNTWAIPWLCIYEFYSVVTNPKIWGKEATTPIQATRQIEAWSASPSLQLLSETETFPDILMKLINQPEVKGPIVHDARIAALCLAHGVERLLTKDRHFYLFKDLTIVDPF